MSSYFDDFEKRKEKPSIIAVVAIMAVIAIVAFFTLPATYGVMNKPPREKMTVGINVPFPPFEDLIGGEFTGLDIDLAYKFGDKYRKDMIIKDYPEFTDIFPALESGEIDMAISAITITSRKEC